jgi:septal ring factor EnvC (AmiA/AmiB activator)
MWPKALAQLLELAPHVGRLVPAANRLLNPGAAAEEASRNSMQQVADGLRGDIGQVTASYDSLSRQLTEQSAKLADLASNVSAAQAGVQSVEARMAALERSLSTNRKLLLLVLLFVVVTLVIAIVHH